MFYFLIVTNSFCQDSYSSKLGVGYNFAMLEMPQFESLLNEINNQNPNLNSSFAPNNKYMGFNLFWAFKSNKALYTLQYSRLNSHYKAEGIIPAISTNSANYSIGSHHNFVTFQYNYLLVPFFGLGLDFGYGYSIFKNFQNDLFFGEVKSTVDKKGGGVAGINALIQVPLGDQISFDLQASYLKAIYKMDMDNIGKIYLGQVNNAATNSDIKGLLFQAKLGIKIQ